MTSKRSAIVLSIDGLGARSLGPYGNTWYRTPQFNRFAASSVLFEHAYATAPDEAAEFWRMISPSRREQSDWFTGLDEFGLETVMLSDDPEVCDWAAARFQQTILVPGTPANRPAGDWTETELARFFSAASDEIENQKEGSLLWLHARGLYGAWDAPAHFRTELAEDDDPIPPDFVATPCAILQENFDPDEVLGFQQAYGAQVHVLDACLSIILDQLDERVGTSGPLFGLFAPRGFPLGEHRIIGAGAASVYDESLHVPLMIRYPDARWAASRSLDLATSRNLTGCLTDWLESHPEFDLRHAPATLPQRRTHWLVARSHDRSTVRTQAWKLITGGEESELYAKPDDRWEQNDVRSRCPEVVDELTELLNSANESDWRGTSQSTLSDSLAFGANQEIDDQDDATRR